MAPSLEATSILAVGQLQWATSTMKRAVIFVSPEWKSTDNVSFPFLALPSAPPSNQLTECLIDHAPHNISLEQDPYSCQRKSYNGCTTTGTTGLQCTPLTKSICLEEHWKAVLKVKLRIDCCPLGCRVSTDKW